MKNFKEKLASVKAFVFDMDGVLTDGSVYPNHEGHLLRKMNIKDGYALQLAVKLGYLVAVISGGKHEEGAYKRLKNLGIDDVFLQVPDKTKVLKELIEEYQIPYDEVLYMGDDVPDYEVMQKVGVPVCPQDAVSDIKNISIYVSPYTGGTGCVRDVIEQALRVQDKWSTTKTNVQSL